MLITEKIDVQNKVINCLISIGWNYLPPSDIFTIRGGSLREPFFWTFVTREKLKELNKRVMADGNVDDIMRRLRLLPASIVVKRSCRVCPCT